MFFILNFSDVCVIRLDFEEFSISGPACISERDGGKCDNDMLRITVSSIQSKNSKMQSLVNVISRSLLWPRFKSPIYNR